ncbi:MAG: ABC transporter ATP-binding protein [Chloroflexi bacterium]|nr:ABC transporter ATP-binding protein [Chloroflexota bacterium]
MSEQYFEEEEFDSEMNGDTIRRIFREGTKRWPYMVMSLACITAVALIEAYLTFLSKRMIDEGVMARDLDALRSFAIQYGAWFLVFTLFVFGFIVATGFLGHLIKYDLRKQMFNHLQNLSLSYYNRTPNGWIMSRVTSDAERVGDLVSWGFLDMTWTITSILAALGFMFAINWKLTLLVLILIPALWKVAITFQRKILHEYRLVRRLNSKITGTYSEGITGVRVVKSLGREHKNLELFQEISGDMYQASYRAAWLSTLFLPAVQLVSATGIALVVWFSGVQFEAGGMTIGGLQAFISYVTFMLWPIQQMAQVYASMQQAVASGERIFSLLDTEPGIVDVPEAVNPEDIRGDIVFDNVSFQYEDGKPVLTDFSLHIPQGETVALVGPTGAGKSTLVNLICRFYEPTAGQILMNGRNYRDLTQHAIQSRVGMVLQTPHLFSGTVMDNLRYGRLDATDAEVKEAARTAGAHGFIMKLEHGFQTEVGEGGVLLSVGQKQLISLARAILAEPDIFIMDEATSSVDTLTEALIQKGMDQLMNGRTSFIIAHRLSTIKNADRILVIENGGVSEMGTHAELIRAQGHYYQLYTQMFRNSFQNEFDLVSS